jgi:hypothetical protein
MSSEERKARNEAAFRAANEQIRERQRSLGFADAPLPFICECERPDCTVVLQIPAAEYERVRGKGTRFLVAAGHEGDSNAAVAEHDGYIVIDKDGIEGAVAEATDPRQEG